MLSNLINKYDKRIRDIIMKLPDGVYIKETPCDEISVKITLIKNLVRPAIYEKDNFFVRLWKMCTPTWMFKIIYDRSQRLT